MNRTSELIVFFDGSCPMCASEMQHLRKLDRHERIAMFDLSAPGATDYLAKVHPDIDPAAADKILHGKTSDGRLILGLDVTHKAWSLVGRGWLTAPLRWRLVAPLSDRIYLLFARHRRRISALLSGRWRQATASCQACQIDGGTTRIQEK